MLIDVQCVFTETCSKRLLDGTEITALACCSLVNANMRIAVALRGGHVTVFHYDGQGTVNEDSKVFSIQLDKTILPIAIHFSPTQARDLNLFGMYTGM